MATTATVNVGHVFPAGTTVNAYTYTGVYEPSVGVAPPANATNVTNAVVSASGTLAYSGLTDNTVYWAGAQVAGVWRFVKFQTTAAPTVNNTAIAPSRLSSPHGNATQTIGLNAAAGTGAVLTNPNTGDPNADDMTGAIQIVVGTSPSIGNLVTVTFSAGFPSTPKIIIAPLNATAALYHLYPSSRFSTAFGVSCASTPVAGDTLQFGWLVLG